LTFRGNPHIFIIGPKVGHMPLKRSITMSRKSESNYVEAAQRVLSDLDGGPISSKKLVAAAKERELIGNGQWVYHNFLRKIREDERFDTSKRGYVSLAEEVVPGADPISVDDPGDNGPLLEATETAEEVETAVGENHCTIETD
jgi:hypothetical protein